MRRLLHTTPARLFSTVRFVLKMHLKTMLGKEVRIESEDRRLLEQVIIPHYAARPDIHRVLFVGCAPYTAHYRSLWPDVEYWTIEISPHLRRYGSAHHIVGSVEDLGQYFSPGSLDLILCNGVYGYGLDTHAACERAFQACFAALRDGGELLLGWDQLPEYTPTPLSEVQALTQFEPNPASVLGAWRTVCDPYMHHTYDFYLKPVTERELSRPVLT